MDIVLSCTEYIGDGKLRAYFGYENKGKKTVVVNEAGSVVTYNHGQAKKLGLYTFEPGVKEKAFYQDFDSKDRVEWTVEFSDGTSKTTDANINSNHCRGVQESLNIIPGYYPPEGGKEYNTKIGAELTALYEAYTVDPSLPDPPGDIFQLAGSKVLIEVVSNTDQYESLIDSLAVLGFELETSDAASNRATGWVEVGDLLLLNELLSLNYARPVYPGVSNANYTVPATGLVKSQGDFAMHSDFVRLGYAVDGAGVKIGVLSNSYNTRGEAARDVRNGDLPGPLNPNGDSLAVQVLKDIVPTHGTLSDEGRAMLQIVHDIAPGAELAFRTGYLGERDMARGIRQLADSGAHIIVDDLSYITEPFFRDGIISQTIDSVVSEGVTFFSSAGNFGRASYTGVYSEEAAPSTISGSAHDFSGNGDIFQSVLLREGNYTLVLQWDDGSDASMSTTLTDLDIFLSDDVGFSLLGFNRENVGGFPIEVVPFSVIGDSVEANVVVSRASGPTGVDVDFKYILFRGGTQFMIQEHGTEGSSTIVGHPNAAGAISVGAVRYDKNPIYNPAGYPEPVIMSFSSVGGTPVDGVVRSKPDITAPNGVNTTVDLGNGDWDSSIDPDTIFPNFFGTSAASPHAAGVAALILEAKAEYDLDSTVTPEDIRALMKSTAIDMDAPGEDLVSGSGFLQAHKAIMTFASPSPYVQNLILASEGGVPGEEVTPFSFTITGDFFTDSTQVWFRGEALDSGVFILDESNILVNHPGFIGNPEVQVYNPPISSGEQDGGTSESIYFSSPVKQKVVITANNQSKKFGAVLPEFTADFVLVTVGGDSLSFEEALQDSLMLQSEVDRLQGLAYTIPATDTSDAGQYIIVPSLDPVLNLTDPQTEIDNAITEKYILDLRNGTMEVEKLALTITPVDTTLVYGDNLHMNGFSFTYQIGDSTVVIPNPDSILLGVQQEHLAALTNEVALVRGLALVNGIPMIRGTALVNGVNLVRGVALVNGVEVKVEVVDSDTTVYVAGEPLANTGTLVRGVALVNDRPFVSMTEIVRGVAMVNGDEVTFDEGYMTEVNGVPLENAVPAVRGVALVNGENTRGLALVNGHTVEVDLSGTTYIDSVAVGADLTAVINGITVLRGTALVNSSNISRGLALVNEVGVAMENGIPTGRGIALVNTGGLRGLALVNGIPMIRGTALVNNLEIHVNNGEVDEVYENGALVNGLNLSRGLALVNEVALVNGGELQTRGLALVNGIALSDDEGDGNDVVNLANMNFMASSEALLNGLNSVRGLALVNGMDSEDGQALRVAAGYEDGDGNIVFENGFESRGVALVNGLNYLRGTALVNGTPLSLRGTALVNSSTISESSNKGTILVFDATELGDTTENVGFTPISFITGTTVGQHWIVPGTYISNNFDISYGLGTLTIEPAPLTITADDKTKVFGEDDPELTFSTTELKGQDTISGALIREPGEDVADYAILQGSVTAGEDYVITYDSATLSIEPASLTIGITAESKEYDGNRNATVSLSDDRLAGSDLDISFSSALFADKHVAEDKVVTVLGLTLSGEDAGNYTANTEATTTADITAKALIIAISAEDKTYDGKPDAATTASISEGLVPEDDVVVSSSSGLFNDKNVGTAKPVTADVATDGADAGNYAANTTASTTANIGAKDLVISITADSRTYNGTADATTHASISEGLVPEDDVVVSSSNGLFNDKNVGTDKPVTADVATSGDDAGNYAANTTASATANITARDLVISITADSKTYDGKRDAVTSASISGGLVAGDALTVNSSNGLFNDKNVGTGKPVTATVSTSGDDAGNYAANTTASTTANITAKELVIGITAGDKTYDGLATAATSASISSGLVPDDNVQVNSTDGQFNNKNVGTDKPVTATVTTSGDDAGNYTANTEASTTAAITARELVIGITALNKTYDGLATAATTASIASGKVAGDVLTVSSSNGSFSDKHVGYGKTVTADVSATGTDAGNYSANTKATTSADITARDLLISITADSKTYDGKRDAVTSASISGGLVAGDALTVNSSNGLFNDKNVGTGKPVTATVSTSGDDAGNYAANSTATALADISPKQLVIGITAENRPYDGTYFAATSATITSGKVDGDALSVSSSNGLFADRNVGTWGVTANVSAYGSDAGNYTANATASTTASISQRAVSVTPETNFFYIREGDPLPVAINFIYSGWITGDAGNQGFTVLRNTDGVAYDPYSSESAGTYTITPVTSNGNYSFTVETGVLHVNPYGPGTRNVKPVLNCIMEMGPNLYVANFEYKNENDVAVYIPLGEDNFLTGSGIDWGSSDAIPTWFEPGGGSFRIYFDGSALSWTVNSRDGDQKVSSAANANSSSTKCQGSTKSSAIATEGIIAEPAPAELVAYPNPVVDKVTLHMENIEHYEVIRLYDFAGRSHPVTSIDKRTDRLEIDMAGLPAGHYIFTVVMEGSSSVVQLVKQ